MGFSALVTLMAFLIGGGSSDLLDYVSPPAYWQDKQVTVSVEAMAKELKPADSVDVSKLIDDLNSPDSTVRGQASKHITETGTAAIPQLREAAESPSPQIAISAKRLITKIEAADRPASVRRLMAIRELGELKNKDALAVLQPLLKSDEPFVADYAREAIDQIDGKPVRHQHPQNLRQEVWLLPDGCRAVGQIVVPKGAAVSLDAAINDIPLPPGEDRGTLLEGIRHMLVSAAENLGNVRLDAVSFGVSGDIGDQAGYAVAIARGRYEPRAIADWMHSRQVPSHLIGGVEVFQPPGDEAALFFPSEEYAVAMASPRGVDLPIQQILDAIHTHQGKLKAVAEMKKLVEAVPADQPIWAVMKVTPAYAQGPVLAPFDALELRSQQNGQTLQITVTGSGTQPDKAKAAAEMINDGARQAADEMSRAERFMPSLKVIGDALRSVKCEAKDGNATFGMKVDDTRSGLFLMPLMMTRTEVHRAAPPQPVPVQPVPK